MGLAICSLTYWCGLSTIFVSVPAQRAAVRLKPAPGNQVGRCLTNQSFIRFHSDTLQYKKQRTCRNSVHKKPTLHSSGWEFRQCFISESNKRIIPFFDPVPVRYTEDYRSSSSIINNPERREKDVNKKAKWWFALTFLYELPNHLDFWRLVVRIGESLALAPGKTQMQMQLYQWAGGRTCGNCETVLHMGEGQMSFSSLLILLPFAKLVCQSKSSPFYPTSLQPSPQSLGSQYADPVPKRRRYHLKKEFSKIHVNWTLGKTQLVSHIPHFLPQSAKVIHTLSEGKSSKFPSSGSLSGPGGKVIEGLVKMCLSDTMTVNIAKAIPSKKRLPIAIGCHNYERCCHDQLYSLRLVFIVLEIPPDPFTTTETWP